MVTVAYTQRPNGNGVPRHGWYITDHGVPLGCPYATREEAAAMVGEYLADVRRCVAGVCPPKRVIARGHRAGR